MQKKRNEQLVPLAKQLRRDMTKEERRLWYDFLRTHPTRFTRQKVLGSYIADFYSAKAALVIELDGSQHTCTVTVHAAKYVAAYSNEEGGSHTLDSADPAYITLTWTGTEWTNNGATADFTVKCTPTEVEPAAPTVIQLGYITLVNVYCTVTEEHGNMNLGYVDNSLVSISEVKNSECTVTLRVQPYVDVFNKYHKGHQAAQSVGNTVTVPLKFNGYNWGIRQKGDEPEYAKVPVYCSETEVEPSAPTDNALGALDGVRVRCTTSTAHKEKTYKINPDAIARRSEKASPVPAGEAFPAPPSLPLPRPAR